MAKVGRKPWIPTPEILKQIEEYAASYLKEEQIAYCVGIHPNQFYTKKHEFPELTEAIARGRARSASEIGTALRARLMEGNTQITTLLAKSRLGLRENDPQVIATVPITLTVDGKRFEMGSTDESSS